MLNAIKFTENGINAKINGRINDLHDFGNRKSLSFRENILSLLDIMAHYRVNIRNKHDGRLLYEVLKC